jgi:hypothetical protein
VTPPHNPEEKRPLTHRFENLKIRKVALNQWCANPGLQVARETRFFYGGAQYLWVLSTKLAERQPSSALNFEVALKLRGIFVHLLYFVSIPIIFADQLWATEGDECNVTLLRMKIRNVFSSAVS